MYQLTSQELLNVEGGATINCMPIAPYQTIYIIRNLIRIIFKV